MNKTLFKNSVKQIYKTRRRFLSILVMAFLGVGVFSGLVATSPDMQESLDQYLDETILYDISVISTLGLTDQDVLAISNIDGVEKAYGVHNKDVLATLNNKQTIVKMIEYNEAINTPYLLSGRMPMNPYECVIDDNHTVLTGEENLIGTTIRIDTEDASLAVKELRIVGVVTSPLFISKERGNTTIGNGTVEYYIYVSDKVIEQDYYTAIYATLHGTKVIGSNTDEYWNIVNPIVTQIESIKKHRENSRYQELVNKATKKLKDSKDALISEQSKNPQQQMNNIPNSKWYIGDRSDNTGYENITDAINSIANLSKMFPVVFYVIAVLISLTSMTRMVEEERIEIGTLKALGYHNAQIMFKYLLYALAACILGGVIGMSVGFYVIPNIIWNIYSIIYKIPNFQALYHLNIGVLGLFIAFLCIGGATFFVAYKTLEQMPSVLMRPKAAKNGKRILLERVSWLWNKLSFSRKIIIRNIFRYKKRALITIIGIAGCTGLILSGFGLKDSIVKIPPKHFTGIYTYETSVYLDHNRDDIKALLLEEDNIEGVVEVNALTGSLLKGNTKKNINIMIPNNGDFKQVCNLWSLDSGELIELSDTGIVISDKLAQLLNVKVGDTVSLFTNDDHEVDFIVENIVKNYVDQYVYISKELYEQKVNQYDTNMLLINTSELTKEEERTLSSKLLAYENVASVSMISDTITTVEESLGSLNYVVLVLIVASALLAIKIA